jgi:hypothetical protein
VNAPREGDVASAVRVHREAQDDWLEAVALVEELRMKEAAARLRAEERLRLAGDALRGRRSDPRTVAILHAAELHVVQARAETERLAAAETRLEALRARALEREGAARRANGARVRAAPELGGRRCG